MKKNKVLLLFSLLFFFLFLGAGNVFSKDMKIGYINLKKVIKESKLGKSKLKYTEKVFKRKQEQLKSLGENIKEIEREFREKELVLSEEAKQEMEENMRKKMLALKRLREDATVEIEKVQKKNMRDLLKVVISTIKEFGEENEYTLILNSLDENFLYLDARLDLSDKIIEVLDRK